VAESAILRRILLACTAMGWRVFRNNCGALQDRNGQWVKYGICNPGGSDCIGWRSVTITADMVGTTIAQFVAVEVKAPKGRTSEPQERFLAAVRDAGGVAILARSEMDIQAAVRAEDGSCLPSR
jgi:hypothetical protein